MNQMTGRGQMEGARVHDQPHAEPLELNADEKHAGITRADVMTFRKVLWVLMEDGNGLYAQGFASPLPGREPDYDRSLSHARSVALRNMGNARDRAKDHAQRQRSGGHDQRDRRNSVAGRHGD